MARWVKVQDGPSGWMILLAIGVVLAIINSARYLLLAVVVCACVVWVWRQIRNGASLSDLLRPIGFIIVVGIASKIRGML